MIAEQEIKSLILECRRDERYIHSPFVKLLVYLSNEFIRLNGCNSESESKEDEWIGASEFQEKYKIIKRDLLLRVKKYCSDFDCYKIRPGTGNKILFNTKGVFKYIVKNKKKFPGIYKKLKEASYFGFDVKEIVNEQ